MTSVVSQILRRRLLRDRVGRVGESWICRIQSGQDGSVRAAGAVNGPAARRQWFGLVAMRRFLGVGGGAAMRDVDDAGCADAVAVRGRRFDTRLRRWCLCCRFRGRCRVRVVVVRSGLVYGDAGDGDVDGRRWVLLCLLGRGCLNL